MNLFGDIGRTRVMGVVNVTPDSFSDGGRFATAKAAVAHGRELVEQGADLLDIGGESTRPGAARVPEELELARVLPVVRELAADGSAVSVDTTRASVARASVEAGACLVNDVSGGLADPEMLPTVAACGAAYVAMHWRGPASDMQRHARYDDVAAEVEAALAERLAAARSAGIGEVAIDPGLGFGKTAEHNWRLLAALPALAAAAPVLVGASRKSFLGSLLAGRPALGRDAASAAVTVLAAEAGCWAVRVHEVAGSADAVRVVAAVRSARSG